MDGSEKRAQRDPQHEERKQADQQLERVDSPTSADRISWRAHSHDDRRRSHRSFRSGELRWRCTAGPSTTTGPPGGRTLSNFRRGKPHGCWMSIDENLDEKAIIEKIRERLRVSVGQAPLPPAQPRPEAAADGSAESLQLELVTMRNEQDVSDAPFKSQRPWLGPLLVLAN